MADLSPLWDMFKDQLKQAGADLEQAGQELIDYIKERVTSLQQHVSTDGYDEAVKIEVGNVRAKIAELAILQADKIDRRILSIIVGLLTLAPALL